MKEKSDRSENSGMVKCPEKHLLAGRNNPVNTPKNSFCIKDKSTSEPGGSKSWNSFRLGRNRSSEGSQGNIASFSTRTLVKSDYCEAM